MKKNRTVMVSEYKQATDKKWNLEEKGVAIFRAFGVNYETHDFGVGIFSTAIIEYSDGKVDNVPVEHIRFIDKEEK